MTAVTKEQEFRGLYQAADEAGQEAVRKLTVVPMVVTGPVGLDNEPLEGCKSWYVEDGACGFAWITVRPGNSPFANWLKKNGLGSKAYYGGVQIWVSQFNQSIQKKEAYAEAFAAKLSEYGITASAGSRLD